MNGQQLRAWAGRVVLDPEPGVPLAGNGRPEQPWQAVAAALEANVVLLDDGTGPLVLVGCDLLYAGGELTRAIRAELADLVAPDRVLVFASHTHGAPPTDPDKPALGIGHPDFVRALAATISGSVVSLLQAVGTHVEVRSGVALADHSINRRRPRVLTRYGRGGRLRLQAIAMAPNPTGPRDETVTALALVGPAGPVAIVWNYACHPVGQPDPLAIDPHYIGVVRDQLRRQLAVPDLPVVFLQGFSGDTKPASPSTVRHPGCRLWDLVRGPDFASFEAGDFQAWSSSLGEVALSAVRTARPVPAPSLRSALVVRPGDRLLAGVRGDFEVAAVRLGDVVIVGAAAEPVTYYAQWLRAALPELRVLPAGCLDAVIGYLPTAAMLAEGGYEAGGFCRWFPAAGVQMRVQAEFCSALAAALSAVDLQVTVDAVPDQHPQ